MLCNVNGLLSHLKMGVENRSLQASHYTYDGLQPLNKGRKVLFTALSTKCVATNKALWTNIMATDKAYLVNI